MAPNVLRSRALGFTLVELMIVVAIIGILAVIAYPAYKNRMVESRRTDARNWLTEIAARQEKFLFNCNKYTINLGSSTNCTLANPGLGLSSSASTSSWNTQAGYYAITITGTTTGGNYTSYTLTATPLGVQAQDVGTCSTLTLSNFGVRGATPAANATKCWK